MAKKKQLVQSEILITPTIDPADAGFIGFGAKDGGLYQIRNSHAEERLLTESDISGFVGPTNLSYTATTTNGTIHSDTGDDAIIPSASDLGAGLLSSEDKLKLDYISENAEIGITNSLFPNASQYKNGDEWTDLSSGIKYTLYDGQWIEFGPATTILGVSSNQTVLFKGSIGEGGNYSILDFNNLTTYEYGWEFYVKTAGLIKGVNLLPGSRLIAIISRNGSGCLNSDFLITPVNSDGAGGVVGPQSSINGYPALFDGTSGKSIKCSTQALGSAAFTNSSSYATSIQGVRADAALPAASYTAQDILNKIKTIDGAGSGLDADLIDGCHITDVITSKNDSYSSTPKVNEIVTMTYSEFYSLQNKSQNTLYVIIGV